MFHQASATVKVDANQRHCLTFEDQSSASGFSLFQGQMLPHEHKKSVFFKIARAIATICNCLIAVKFGVKALKTVF